MPGNSRPSGSRSSSRTPRGPMDPWFMIGTTPVTTSLLIPLLAVIGWIVVAVDTQDVLPTIWLSRAVYRQGFLWQLFTWPLASTASFFGAVGLFFFWSLGHILERPIGPSRYLRFLVTGIVLSAIGALLISLAYQSGAVFVANAIPRVSSTYQPVLVGPHLLSMGVAACVAIEAPTIKSFFGIPFRVLVAVFVAIDVLQYMGKGFWEGIFQIAITIAVFLGLMRPFGMGSELPSWVPTIPVPKRVSGNPYSTTRAGSRPSRGGGGGSAKFPTMRRGGSGAKSDASKVVTGPWGERGTGTASESASQPRAGSQPTMTKTDREAVDRLLDKIAQEGMESLTAAERSQLEAASRKLREPGR